MISRRIFSTLVITGAIATLATTVKAQQMVDCNAGGTIASVLSTLKPGETHQTTITVQPDAQAKGSFPIGLAVLTPQGNSLAMSDLKVE